MVDQKSEESNDGVIRIEPVAINLTTNTSSDQKPKLKSNLKHSPLVWIGLGVLLSSVLLVVFVLPHWVGTPEQTPASLTPAAEPSSQVSQPMQKKGAVSPWEKAQESKLRKETQNILSQMLEAQEILSEKGVEVWANKKYSKAMQFATAGDDLYNQRDFINSRVEYEKALSIFTVLVEQIDIIFENTMDKGNKALAEGDSKAAMKAFQLALAIDAIDRDAIVGQTRAESLDQFISLMKLGDELLDEGKLDEAKQNYQNAWELDNDFDTAKQKIAFADEKILDRAYNKHMSAGFVSMGKRQLTVARESFNKALKLKPRSAEARNALNQTKHDLTTININSLQSEARALEEKEDWHAALEKYNAALALNSSLAEAQTGKQRITLRGKIHDRIEQILSQPKRIYDPKVFEETTAFQTKLSALTEQGPLLRKQLAALDRLLHKANTPVDVLLRSDNQTLVTLRKVDELGLFTERSLSLRPGQYVAVGIRQGYRDVRVTFMLDPDKSMQIVTIQAAEKIALGN
jgi:tetratricopeptide (TPR) repeat protein